MHILDHRLYKFLCLMPHCVGFVLNNRVWNWKWIFLIHARSLGRNYRYSRIHHWRKVRQDHGVNLSTIIHHIRLLNSLLSVASTFFLFIFYFSRHKVKGFSSFVRHMNFFPREQLLEHISVLQEPSCLDFV